jgi:hypothetical protein
MLEQTGKVMVVGEVFFHDWWNIFDFVILTVSLISYSVLLHQGSQGMGATKILQFLCIIILFRRIRNARASLERIRQQAPAGAENSAIPAERIQALLMPLKFSPVLNRGIRREIAYAVQVIADGNLYALANLGDSEGIDATWIRTIESLGSTAGGERERTRFSRSGSLFQHGVGGELQAYYASVERREETNYRYLTTFLDCEFPKAKDEIEKALEGIESWDFDAPEVERVSNGNSLLVTWTRVLLIQDCSKYVVDDLTTFQRFATKVQECYFAANPYHNAIHGADVCQGLSWFLLQGSLADDLDLSGVEVFAAVLAAACHDIGHPGVNNAFLVTSRAPLANLYNDRAVLENHHASYTFRLLHRQMYDFAKSMQPADAAKFRLTVIEMILATDMQTHFAELTLFNLKAEDEYFPQYVEDRLLALKILLHACDISTPTRKLDIYLDWTKRVVTEFFIQGELEKRNKFPPSMFMNRETTNIAKMQLGFIDIFVQPLFLALEPFCPEVEMVHLQNIVANRNFWVANQAVMQESMEERGNLASVYRGVSASNDGFLCTARELKLWLPRYDETHTEVSEGPNGKRPNGIEEESEVSWPDPHSELWHDPYEEWDNWDRDADNDKDSDWETVIMPSESKN